MAVWGAGEGRGVVGAGEHADNRPRPGLGARLEIAGRVPHHRHGGSATPSRSMAPKIMSGAGRPRPQSAGESARSMWSAQPSRSIKLSRVEGAKPVVRHTLTPPARRASKTSTAPGMADTSPAATMLRTPAKAAVAPAAASGSRSGRTPRPWTGPSSPARRRGPREPLAPSARPRPRRAPRRRPRRPRRRRARWYPPCRGRPARSGRSSQATPAALRVSAAMAGAQVMPRPPGPVTSHTPGEFLAGADWAAGALGVDTLPAPPHRRGGPSPQRAARSRSSSVGSSHSAKSNGSS